MYIIISYCQVLVSSRLPSSTRYGAEAEPRGHIEVERGEAVNYIVTVLVHVHTEKLIDKSPLI